MVSLKTMHVPRRMLGVALVFLCCIQSLNRPACAADSPLPEVPYQTGADFWTDGQPPNLAWPANLADPSKHDKLVIWGSWCSHPESTGQIILGPFIAPSHFSIAVSGKPSADGNVLALVRLADGAQIVVTHDDPGTTWKQVDLDLPADWVGTELKIVAYDRSTTPDGWLAFSEPFIMATDGTVQPLWQNRTAGPRWHRWLLEILGPLIAIFLVLGLVGISGFSILRRYVPTDPYLAPLLIAAVMAFAGYVTFWAYFAGPKVGRDASLAIILLAGICFPYRVLKKNLLPREDLKELGYPVALLAVAALFYLGVLWLPRAEGSSMSLLAGCRMTTWGLPSDNALQEWLAEALHAGKSPKVVNSPEWSSSDRPPLQAGVQLLSARLLVDVFHVRSDVSAQLTGLLLQLSWVYALWALLRGLRCSPRAAMQIVLCLIPTPLLYINSVFVWAKLSAAAFAIGMTVLLCFRGKRPLGLPEAAIAGALLSLAMLCHSGIFFYALPVLGLWFILPNPAGRPTGRAVLVLILVSVALFLPWTCYQKFFDPPGNHLFKLSFAGVIDSNSRSVFQTVRTAYSALSMQTIVANKISNFTTPFKGDWTTLLQLFPANRADRRLDNFFFLFRSCGVFMLGCLALPLLLLPRNKDKRRPVLFLLSALALAFIFWCVMLFVPNSTVIHAGAFGVPLVLLALLAYLLRLLHPIALLIAGVYNLVQFLWIYGWTFPYPPTFDGLSVTAIIFALGVSLALLLLDLRGKPARIEHQEVDAIRPATSRRDASQ